MYNEDGNITNYYFQRNLQGDVVAIYNTSGTKIVEYAYDAWGNCTIVYSTNDTLANDNPIRYRGYYLDIENNFYYLNARYYSPEWRRFISPDDTSYLDPESVNGLNLYCYCNNDPVNYCDPSGHKSKWWWNALKIVGAISIVATLTIAATIVTGGTATVLLAGAAMGSAAGLIGGGISGGISSVISGGNFIDGFANGALSGSITGGVSGAFAASSVGIWGQVGINMLISGTNYTIANYNNFNWLDFGMNTFIGGLAGFVGGDGWMTAGSAFAYDFALNGVKGSFVRIGYGYLREFADPVIKSTIVGSSTFVTEIIRLMR